jgi:hypothetical protein
MNGLKPVEYICHRWPPIKLIVVSGKVSLDEAALPEGGLSFINLMIIPKCRLRGSNTHARIVPGSIV